MPRGSPFTKLCQQTASLTSSIYADLHTHTTASDGKCSAYELLQRAEHAKVKVIALTDHDTLPILDEKSGLRSRLPGPVTVLTGVEISTHQDGVEHHIIGLFVSSANEALNVKLTLIQQSRRERFNELTSLLRANHGCGFTPEKLEAVICSTRSLTRRHVAELLIGEGLVRSHHQAFAQYIGPASRSLTLNHCISLLEAVQLIHEAKGIAIVAHPRNSLGFSEIHKLKEMGVDGLECSFPGITASRKFELESYAKSLNLVTSGGSDFHNDGNRTRTLGSFGVTEAEFQRLSDCCQQYR
jgi:3',5'-nucleoside bisphosphate phosphatase